MDLVEAVALFVGVFLLVLDLDRVVAPPIFSLDALDRQMAALLTARAVGRVEALTDEAVLAMLAEVRRQLVEHSP